MKAVSSTYFETDEETRPAADVPGIFAGATVGSGIEHDILEFPSPSMTLWSGAVAMSVFDLVGREGSPEVNAYKTVWISRHLEGMEFSGLYTVRQLPNEVLNRLRIFRQQEGEDQLYETANALAEWATEASSTEQAALALEFCELHPRNVSVLLAALADSEVQLRSESLVHTIAGLLSSGDKRLAQTAAICLLQSGGGLGRSLLQFRLTQPDLLPHAELIVGVIKLLPSG